MVSSDIKKCVIVGAGPSGLAVAASLSKLGVRATILEREATLGSAWRRHYDRLALHTARARSHLPGLPFPKNWPQYVPRKAFVSYLEDYAKAYDLAPIYGAEVHQMTPAFNGWCVRHSQGEVSAQTVVLATGFADTPHMPTWPGFDGFPGPVLHTRAYRRPSDLPGQRVLVVGFGNSGGELAIDLVDDGRDVTMAVRGPVNLLPKELFGIPIGNFGLVQNITNHKIGDFVAAPLLRWKLGDYSRYGLQKSPKGPNTQIVEDGRIPLIDLGTLALIREGKISVCPGIDHFDGAEVTFVDGQRHSFDAVLMATGYRVDLRNLLPDTQDVLDNNGMPTASGEELAPGLFGVSYHAVPNGQLKEIARQAPRIAQQIAANVT